MPQRDDSPTTTKPPVHLLELIRPPHGWKRESSRDGGEYSGPCPLCVPGTWSGTDRLRVKPGVGRWYCRRCSPTQHWESAADFVMRRDGHTDFPKAMRTLGLPVGTSLALDAWDKASAPERPPANDWVQAATTLTKRAHTALLGTSTGAVKARGWLKARGITESTIAHFGLGYLEEDSTPLGFADEDGDINVPHGIIIPARGMDNQLWGVKVATGKAERKYHWVRGSEFALQGTNTDKPYLLIVEGEFDMILGWQEIGHLVDVATLGSATTGLANYWLPWVTCRQLVVPLYDQDEPGFVGAQRVWGWLRSRQPERPLRLPQDAKDLTEFVVSRGGDLTHWATTVALPYCQRFGLAPKRATTESYYESVVRFAQSIPRTTPTPPPPPALELDDEDEDFWNTPAPKAAPVPTVEELVPLGPAPAPVRSPEPAGSLRAAVWEMLSQFDAVFNLSAIVEGLREVGYEEARVHNVEPILSKLVEENKLLLEERRGRVVGWRIHPLAKTHEHLPVSSPITSERPYWGCSTCGKVQWYSHHVGNQDVWSCGNCHNDAGAEPEWSPTPDLTKLRRP